MTKRQRPKAPKVSAPTLYEACERVAEALESWPADKRLIVADGVELWRPDLVALVAACGWNLSLEQATDSAPAELENVAMFDA